MKPSPRQTSSDGTAPPRWVQGVAVALLALFLLLLQGPERHAPPGTDGRAALPNPSDARLSLQTPADNPAVALPASILTPEAEGLSPGLPPRAAATEPRTNTTPTITVVEASLDRTLLVVTSPLPVLEEVTVAGRKATRVHLGKARQLKQRGCPALPFVRTNLLIADRAVPSLQVVESTYVDQPTPPPEPSLGFVERGSAAETSVQPHFGPAYPDPRPYPETPARLTAPYRIRRLRGVGVLVAPTQYLPGEGTLRTYTRLVLEITAPPPNGSESTIALPQSTAFTALARASFSNFAQLQVAEATPRAALTETTGSATRASAIQDPLDAVLVITSTVFTDHVAPFVLWKRQRGFVVKTATYPTDTGTGASALKEYIRAQYEDANVPVSHVILVSDYDGDETGNTDIPVYQTSPHASDAMYTTLTEDDYHDLIISRISAETVLELENQLTKFVEYEKSPQTGDDAGWYTSGAMVASNEGPGKSAFGKYDWEILGAERDDLLANGFADVATINDPGATADEVVDAWNAGCSLIYYLGHGSETSWQTTGFSTSMADTRLTNGHALPMVLNGNCQNGDFLRSGGDCLAEAILKAGTSASPAGGIAAVSSTTDMDWDPPIVMAQAFTDYLLGHDPVNAGDMTFDGATVSTLGTHVVLSLHRAMDYCIATPDEGTGAARKIMQQVHLFGDCTLDLRTSTPMEMVVTHDPSLTPGHTLDVTVATPGGAPLGDVTACLYAAPDKQYVSRTDAAGYASLSHGLGAGESGTLTVYRTNAIPVQISLQASGGPPAVTSTPSLPAGFVGEPYTFSPSAGGGVPPLTWGLTGADATWLLIDPATGELSGTPDAAGTVTATLQVTDSEEPPQQASQPISFPVGTPVSIATTTLASGTVGQPYDGQVLADGTFAPITFELGSRALPTGLSLSSQGTIQGTPTRSGAFTFDVVAHDQQGRSDSAILSMQVDPAATISIDTASPLPPARQGGAYNVVLAASGGSGSGFVWGVVAGGLPTGTQLTPSGTLYGTPRPDGEHIFTVSVADDQTPPVSTQKAFVLTVNGALHVVEATLPDASVGIPYSASIAADGGQPPYIFVAAETEGHTESNTTSTFTEAGQKQTWVGDETEWDLDLPFPFVYHGTAYTTCRVGDNGYVVFGNDSPDPFWNAAPGTLSPLVMIAPFWTDLIIEEGNADTGIFLDETESGLTIRWCGHDYHEETDVINVAVTLNHNGSFRFSYGAVATTNRVVVGFSNGGADSMVVTYSHAWVEKNPSYVVGWANHDDITFTPQDVLPEWLSLQADGQITGTPLEAGSVPFTVQISDAGGETVTQQFALDVTLPPQADPNQDGDVDNTEILAFIELWTEGAVTEEQVRDAIDLWRTGPPVGRSQSRRRTPLTRGPQPKPRMGEILVLQLPLADPVPMARSLFEAGFDVARLVGDRAEIYATPDELNALVEAGFTPVVSGRQFVGAQLATAEAEAQRDAPPGYTTYSDMATQLHLLAQDHPEICRVASIGQSVQGRELWRITLSDNPDAREAEPVCRLVATMHGDEPIGTDLCLRFLELIANNYGGSDAMGQRATALVNNTRLTVLPCMNPDGFESRTRYNANGVDLNRDFPDGALSDIGTMGTTDTLNAEGQQPETAAVMQWTVQSPFALSASFHSGAFLVCFPYGNNPQQQDTNTPTPDDTLFRQLAGIYANNHATMATASIYQGGVINGAQWYAVNGEMGDWAYRYCGGLETTVELSNTKTPDAALLPAFWENNREAIISYVETAATGVGGITTDAPGGNPLWARVTPLGIGVSTYSDATGGDYHRLLLPGTYTLEFASPGHWTREESVIVTGAEKQRLDVALTPADHTVTRRMQQLHDRPDDTVVIDLEIDVDDGVPPSGIILTESISSGFTYLEGTTVDGSGAGLADPREDGSAFSWLIWGDDLTDSTLRYELDADEAHGPTRVDGALQTVLGEAPAFGPKEWLNDGELEWTIELAPGWNLVSVPLELSASAPEQVFGPELPSIFSWDGSSYSVPTSIEPKNGYWIHTAGARSITVLGTRPESPNRQFTQGWNLFGCTEANTQLTAPQLFMPIWGWGNEYEEAVELVLGKGYWCFSTEQIDVPLTARSR
ncbi:MAG: hypothetical protein HON70_44585 [Lentisphaerae bacterium]|nr:hypothetical protein [Lentisphaerota bacterium]